MPIRQVVELLQDVAVRVGDGAGGAQVGDVFEDIYGEHYSKASISRMMDYMRNDVDEWLERSLEEYYPVVFIDCVVIKVHRKRS